MSIPPGSSNNSKLRVFFVNTGAGIYNRGMETTFIDAYDGMKGRLPDIEAYFFKGGGDDRPETQEKRLFCLPRTGKSAKWLSKVLRRSPYTIEQMTFLPALIRQIRRHRPDVIYYGDMNLGMKLFRWRERIDVPYRLLYVNGAQLVPPFRECDHVQQVTPVFYEKALAGGEPADRHSLVPHGFVVPEGPPDLDLATKNAIRDRLNLPTDRTIVLSVGALNINEKRMDHVVREIAAIPKPRPYLVMLGVVDAETPALTELASKALGENEYTLRTVPYSQVSDYYRSADVFAMASMYEAFGRVYIEALIHGLPTIGHDHPVIKYVLGDVGNPIDMSEDGRLTQELSRMMVDPEDEVARRLRRESVRSRFGWEALLDAHVQLFRHAASGPVGLPRN